MKTVAQIIAEMSASTSEYVTYGESEIGIPIKREDAIAEISRMGDMQIGKGTWYECDEKGNINE